MQELLEKRASLESELKALEKQIFDLETNYIEETQNTGNVIKGWDGFLTNKNTKASFAGIKKQKCNNSERIFSLSSFTSPAARALEEESDRSILNGILPANYQSKRNKKKKNYAKYTELVYTKEKKDDIFGYDEDDRGNDSSDYLKSSAAPIVSKSKTDQKKIGKKLKTKSKKTKS